MSTKVELTALAAGMKNTVTLAREHTGQIHWSLVGEWADLLDQIAAQMPAWQPIATAPRDGRGILVDGGVAHWSGGAWCSITGYDYPGKRIEWPVTYWMPLPSYPSELRQAMADRRTE